MNATTKRDFFTACYLSSVVVLLSCVKTGRNECTSYENAPVTKVDGPNAGAVNQDLSFTVSFTCFDGCGQSGRAEEHSTTHTRTINVVAKYQGCVCTQMLMTMQTVYTFRATQAGTYYLNFWQSENSYLKDTIVIR